MQTFWLLIGVEVVLLIFEVFLLWTEWSVTTQLD